MEYLHQFFAIFSSEGIARLIQQFGLLGICAIIFAETGFFALLPGDSLLVLCGIFAATLGPDGHALLSIAALLIIVPLCAVAGDQLGFGVGRWLGKGIYKWKPFSLAGIPLYKPEYLKRTEGFYQRWGAFTVVAGRWVPIVRTFAPIVAGVTKMPYSTFVPFNIVGALTWVWSMVLAGYFLPPVLAKVAPGFDLAKNIDKIALIIVFLSVLPIVYTMWKEGQTAPKGASSGRGAKAAAKPKKRKR